MSESKYHEFNKLIDILYRQQNFLKKGKTIATFLPAFNLPS